MRAIFCLILFLIFLNKSFCASSLAITLEEEQRYGREIHREITSGAKINTDFMVSLYVEEIKRKLEHVTNPSYPLRLTIIESRNVDAFATIGGYIYLTTGLIELCEKQDELAGVLAHEIAHLIKRHVAKRLEKEKYLNIGRMATVLLGMLVGDPKAKEAIFASGMGALQSVSLMYSREDEMEADTFGSGILERAGFSCIGLSDFLKRLRLTSKDVGLPQYLLTHPYHEERILKLDTVCKKDERREKRDDLFGYFIKRVQILNHPSKTELIARYTKKYEENRRDATVAYGASLLCAIMGNREDAIRIIKDVDSQFRNLFLGEVLFLTHNYKEAVKILEHEDSPYGKYILARSFEEIGELAKAKSTYGQLLTFADSFPEIYLRFGMVSGRLGDEAQGFEYLGRYYLLLGKDAEAKIHIEKAISKYGVNSEKAKELMDILKTLGKR